MTPALVSALVVSSYAAARIWAILRAQALYRTALVGGWWAWSAGLAVALALAFSTTSAEPATWPGSSAWLVAIVFEVGLGTAIGMIVALPGYAVLGAARESLSALRVRDHGPSVGLVAAISLAGGVAIGLHRPMFGGLLGILERWAPGRAATWSVVFERADVAVLATDLGVLALALATPVLLCAAVADLAGAWLTRGPAPSRGVEPATSWARFALSTVALGASWEAYAPTWFA